MPEQNGTVSPVAFATSDLNIFRRDLIISAVIGFLCAVLILPIAQNLNIQQSYAFVLLAVLPVLCIAGMAVAYWLAKKIKVFYQIAKFVLVGAFNTFLDWGVLNLLMFLASITAGSLYVVFKGISFLVAMASSYFWNKFWTFKKSSPENASEPVQDNAKEMLRFFIVSLIGFLMNVGAATLLVNVLGPQAGLSKELWANVGALAGTVLGMTWNFAGYKLIVFKS